MKSFKAFIAEGKGYDRYKEKHFPAIHGDHHDQGYSINTHRNGTHLVVKTPSKDGFMTRSGRLAQALKGRWVHREGGYVMSHNAVKKFQEHHKAGSDASAITGKIEDKRTK